MPRWPPARSPGTSTFRNAAARISGKPNLLPMAAAVAGTLDTAQGENIRRQNAGDDLFRRYSGSQRWRAS